MIETANVQQARDHVAKLAREIEALADAGGPPETFFTEFLARLVTVLGADAGAVFLRDASNRVQLLCEVKLAATGFYQWPEARRINEKILGEVLETGQAMIKAADEGGAEMPTPHVLLLAAVLKGKECVGVVEIFQRTESPREARPGYLQFMEQMCGHASRFLENQEAARKQITPIEFWKQFERFMLQMQRSLDIAAVANTVANDGRQIIQCDRVSVILKRGAKAVATAVSGADAPNRRANTVRLMEKLADRVISAGEPLFFTGLMEKLAPQIEKPLGDYIHESNVRLIYIVPLFEPEPLIPVGDDKDKPMSKPAVPKRAFGALFVEQVSESRAKTGLTDRADLVADHAAAALHNAVTHQSLFLLPLWRFLGDGVERLRGRTLAKVVAVAVVLAVVTIALILVPWEYRVEGKGRLMPVIQRDVFATWDGEVVEIFVNSGSPVKAGDPLVRLRNEELQAKLIVAQREVQEKTAMENSLQKSRDDALKKADQNTLIEIDGKIVQTRIEIVSAKLQVKLLSEQNDLLTVRAPISGVVPTFQVDQLLRNRPVARGEKLLEVMDETGPWRLELEVPEKRMGHVLRRQMALNTIQLPVEFLPATSTETTFHGTLTELAARSTVAEGEGSIVEVMVAIDKDEKPELKSNLRIGAEVRGKISCGERSLGYVLFGDVIEFVHKYVVFW